MAVKEIKSKWDYPDKSGMYWIFASIHNEDKQWMIAQYSNGYFYIAGTTELGSSVPGGFNWKVDNISRYKSIPKPRG